MVDKVTLDGLRISRPEVEARSSKRWWVIVPVLLVLAAGIAWAVTRSRAIEVRVAPARGVAAGSGGGAVLNASGYVTARRQATVSSKVTGKVIEILIEEGMQVKEGQVLARLDASFASRGVALARAEATAAASALEETRVRIREAQLDYDRAQRLAQSEIASKADADRARAQLDAARARLNAQSDQLATSRRQVELQNQNVEDLIIRAPFDGVVVSKDAQPGEMISPVSAGGGFTRTGIGTIVDMSSLEIEVDVNEAYINRVHPGQRVEAVLDAYPDWRIPAHVITAVPTADRQKATVKVRIALDQKDQRVLPDMGVKVSFITDEPAGATTTTMAEVPKTAVRRDGEQDIVFIVKDGRAERRAVKVASAEGATARIASGVAEGEVVIVEGPPELKDGDKVTDGAVGLGQVDAAQSARRTRSADVGHAQVAGDRDRIDVGGALARWRSRHIGFVFQLYNLLPVLTAERNVELPLLLTNLSKKRARSTSDDRAQGRRPLADRAKHYPAPALGRTGAARRHRARHRHRSDAAARRRADRRSRSQVRR
jgi:HlyD family secretion protein